MPENDSNTEIWKPVTGFEGYYSVSNFGRIRSERTIHQGFIDAPAVNGGIPISFVVVSARHKLRSLQNGRHQYSPAKAP
jgi:hypothetical protein